MDIALQRTRLPSSLKISAVVAAIAIVATAGHVGGLAAVAGILGLALLAVFSFCSPDKMLLVTVSVMILVSVQLAIKHDPFPRIGPTRIMLAALVIGWFLNLLTRPPEFRWHSARLRPLPLLTVVVLYSVFVVLSALLSIKRRESCYAASKEILEQFILFYMLVFHLRIPGFWMRLKRVIFGTTAVVCLLSFFEELTRYNPLLPIFGEEEQFRGGLMRVRATFFHPIAFGCFLALVYPFIFVEFIHARDVWKKIYGALLCCVIGASVLTVSRGPWMAIILETAIILIWRLRQERKSHWAVVALLLGVSGISCAILVLDRSSVFSADDHQFSLNRADQASSEYYRLALTEAVVDRLEGKRWIYGFGLGTFYLADVESRYDDLDHVLTAGDSHYVLLLFELGLVGLLLFLCLLAAAAWSCIKAIRCTGARQYLAVASFAAVAGFCLNNLTASMFQLLPLNMLFWVAVALASTRWEAGTHSP